MAEGGPFGPASVVVFGLLSAIAWGAGDFAGGVAGRRVSVLALVLATQIVGMAVALVLAVLRAEAFPAPADLGWAAMAGVFGAIGILGLYTGLAVGRMGVVAPVTGVLGAGVPVLVGVALEGLPPPIAVAGIAAAIVAVVLVSRIAGSEGQRSGIELALVGGVGIGLFNITVTRVDEALVFGPLTVVRLAAAAFIALALLSRRKPVSLPPRLVPLILVIGVLDMTGNAGYLLAEASGSLAVAAVLSSLYPVTTVVLAIAILREPVTRQHALGIGLALFAIAAIGAGSA